MESLFYTLSLLYLALLLDINESCRSRPDPPRNSPPSITCPTVPSEWVTFKGEKSRAIDWPSPSVVDKEDSSPRYRQTKGLPRGSIFYEGIHVITYTVEDSAGASDTCTFSFWVKVPRCSSNFLTLSYGTVSCHGAPEKNLYGSRCQYRCDLGYRLVGSSVAECQENEAWTRTRPRCTAVNCGPPPRVTNGHLHCCEFTYGSHCSLSCNNGFTTSGSSQIFCQSSGQWTVHGLCTDLTPPTINCGPDVEVYAGPKRGKVSVVWSTPSAWDNSGHVTVASDVSSGSFFEVGQHLVNFYATNQAGLRSHCVIKINVKVKVCPVFEPPQNSTTVCSHENVLGSECTVLCLRGFQLVGDALHVCQDNSLWAGEGAACQRRICQPPQGQWAHGNMICSGLRFQDTCHLACHHGFTPVGAGEITCQEDLTWTKSGYCQDVQPPVFVDGCHGDIHKEAASLGEDTRVVYNFPRVSDNSGQFLVSGNPQSGSRFQVGVTLVTLTAVDVSNNSVTCSFHVNVTYARCETPNIEQNVNSLIVYDCPNGHVIGASCQLTCRDGSEVKGPKSIHCSRVPDGSITWVWSGNTRPSCGARACKPLPPPDNGALSCDNTNGTSRVCVVTCNENFVRQDAAPSSYMCMLSSQSWSPRSFVPNCLAVRRPNDVMTSPNFYYYSGNCSSDVSVIRDNFLTALSGLDLLGADGKVDVREVTVTCGRQSRGQRLKRDLVYVYKVTPLILIATNQQKNDVTRTETFYRAIVDTNNRQLFLMSTSGVLDLPGVGRTPEFETGRLEFSCEPGTRRSCQSFSCVGCGQGYVFDTKTDKCRECPKDTYQDQDIGFTCKPCPTGTATVYMGSVSLNQCQEHCPAGHYSDTGTAPCQKCPTDFNQSQPGEDLNHFCPYDLSTSQIVSTSVQDCSLFPKRLVENSTIQILEVKDDLPVTFTFMTWLSSDVTLRFSLEHSTANTSCAGLVLGHVTICLDTDFTHKSRLDRVWRLLGLVYTNRSLTLYNNGQPEGCLQTEMRNLSSFIFRGHGGLTHVWVSGVRLTPIEFTDLLMSELASSCLAEREAPESRRLFFDTQDRRVDSGQLSTAGQSLVTTGQPLTAEATILDEVIDLESANAIGERGYADADTGTGRFAELASDNLVTM